MVLLKMGHCLVPGYPFLQLLAEVPGIDSVLLLVPPQFLEIQVNEVPQEAPPGVNTSQHHHILAHQSTAMRTPALHQLLASHLHYSRGHIVKIHNINRTIAHPTLPAHVVCPHPPEHDRVPVFVEDSGVVTSGGGHWELLGPRLGGEGVDVSCSVGEAAVSADDDCRLVINDGGVAFTGGRGRLVDGKNPGVESVGECCVLVVGDGYFDNFANLRVQSRQTLPFVIVNVEQLLILEGFLDKVKELDFPLMPQLDADLAALVSPRLQHLLHLAGALCLCTNAAFICGGTSEPDFIELVEPWTDGAEETVSPGCDWAAIAHNNYI